MPITLSPSNHNVIADGLQNGSQQRLLHHVLHQKEFVLRFEFVDFLETHSLHQNGTDHRGGQTEMTLFQWIETISIFAHLLLYRETVLLSVAHSVCFENRTEIVAMNNEKDRIAEFAKNQIIKLLAHILRSWSRRNGRNRRVERLQWTGSCRGRGRMTCQLESGGKICGMDFYKMKALIDVKMSCISKDMLWSFLLIIDIFGLFMTQNARFWCDSGSGSLWVAHSRRSSGWTQKPSQPHSLGIGWVSSVQDCAIDSQHDDDPTFCMLSADAINKYYRVLIFNR